MVAEKETTERENGWIAQEALLRVRELVHEDKRFECDDSDEFLTRFVKVCNCNVEESYQLILSYLQAKKEYPEALLFNSPADYLQIIGQLELGFVLQQGDTDGRPLLFLRFGNIDPAKESWPMLMQSGSLILESLSFDPYTQESGVSLVMDCTNFSLKIMKWATPYKLKALMKFVQECIPVRFDYLHIVNAPLTFRVFYAAISPFVAEGVTQKIKWHSRPFKTLLTALGPSSTPKHLGGTLDINDMKNWYQEVVLEKESHLIRCQLDLNAIHL